jgi:HAMP domain-containing protein
MEKRKLSREELLAGKCHPDERGLESTDPRFKSPDDVLLQMLSQKRPAPAPADSMLPEHVTIEHGYMKERKLEAYVEPEVKAAPAPQPVVIPNEETEELKKEINALHQRYNQDRVRWKDYEQKVIQWKEQVMDVIRNIQSEAADVEVLKKEMEALKEANRKKDEEIENLADEIHTSHKKKK